MLYGKFEKSQRERLMKIRIIGIIEKQERERKEFTPYEEQCKVICTRMLVICMGLTGPLMQNLVYFSDKWAIVV